MTNKLSGRYCFEQHWSNENLSDYNLFYCIPIELQNKFREMKKEVSSLIWTHPQNEFFQKSELFDSTFQNYLLDRPIEEYSFTDLQEIEE